MNTKQIGGIKRISMNLTQPMKIEFQDIDYNKLTLMTGMNNTGKSFINKNVWAMSVIANLSIPLKGVPTAELAEFVYNGTIGDNNMTGMVWAFFDNGANVKIAFIEGKVLNISTGGIDGDEVPSMPTYMSAQFRSFTALNIYVAERSLIKQENPGITSEQLISKLLGNFKLYDIMYIESLISKMPKKIEGKIKETLENQFNMKEDMAEINVDDQGFYYLTNSGDRRSMSYTGSGYQALLNMLIGTGL